MYCHVRNFKSIHPVSSYPFQPGHFQCWKCRAPVKAIANLRSVLPPMPTSGSSPNRPVESPRHCARSGRCDKPVGKWKMHQRKTTLPWSESFVFARSPHREMVAGIHSPSSARACVERPACRRDRIYPALHHAPAKQHRFHRPPSAAASGYNSSSAAVVVFNRVVARNESGNMTWHVQGHALTKRCCNLQQLRFFFLPQQRFRRNAGVVMTALKISAIAAASAVVKRLVSPR